MRITTWLLARRKDNLMKPSKLKKYGGDGELNAPPLNEGDINLTTSIKEPVKERRKIKIGLSRMHGQHTGG